MATNRTTMQPCPKCGHARPVSIYLPTPTQCRRCQLADARSAKPTTSNTGYRGVCYQPKGHGLRPYRAGIGYKGKKIDVGNFADAISAAHARDARAIELFGTKTTLNFCPVPGEETINTGSQIMNFKKPDGTYREPTRADGEQYQKWYEDAKRIYEDAIKNGASEIEVADAKREMDALDAQCEFIADEVGKIEAGRKHYHDTALAYAAAHAATPEVKP